MPIARSAFPTLGDAAPALSPSHREHSRCSWGVQNRRAVEPAPRPAARVLLFDPGGRLLMFRAFGSSDEHPELWITPGGGLESGESCEAAAKRELWEETGISVEDVGPCVWVRDHVFRWEGRLLRSVEQFFVVRAPRKSISTAGWTEEEREQLREARWWTQSEILGSSEVFVPRNLGELIGPLISGSFPDTPIAVGP